MMLTPTLQHRRHFAAAAFSRAAIIDFLSMPLPCRCRLMLFRHASRYAIIFATLTYQFTLRDMRSMPYARWHARRACTRAIRRTRYQARVSQFIRTRHATLPRVAGARAENDNA
jgi:hypothetical protein